MPCLSLGTSSLIYVWSFHLIFLTALESESPGSRWWGLPGSSLAGRVPASTSCWLWRLGLGSETLHFNKLSGWFQCRWHWPLLETLWLREHSEIDWHVSILSTYFQEGASELSCVSTELPTASLQCPSSSVIFTQYSLKLGSISSFHVWSNSGHILKLSA